MLDPSENSSSKMIQVTVKTLDSQNHQFSVEDSLTVEQFKNHIAETVNIPAERQRIIYCGRVLQDTGKLSEYDVDGKVVHLVQRAPPSATNRSARSNTPPPEAPRSGAHPRGFRGFDRVGNTVYMGMGSMTIPQGLMEPPQHVMPPRATHTLSASRLNVARRMLRSAENIIRQLENPTASNEQQPAEENNEEEMTPVIEARLIVPSIGDQPIDETAVLNAVENSIFGAGVGNLVSSAGPSASTSSLNVETSSGQQSSCSTPGTATPRSSSTENLASGSAEEPSRDNRRPSRVRCRLSEMDELLTTLNQLQSRFAPFLARYQSFMQEDPQIAPEDLQLTRQLLSRVSQVMHYFAHAYHSLSDIMVNVDQQPPRLLLCRPILIQHSAVVQAGIPIQVEAQINLGPDRTAAQPNTTNASTTGTSTNTAGTDGATSGTTPNVPNAVPNFTLQPGFVGLPFMPTRQMRVITTPVEIRTVRPSNVRPRANNNNNTAPAAPSATNQNVPSAPPAPDSSQPGQQAPPQYPQAPPQWLRGTPPAQPQGGANVAGPFGNSGNMEIFMEVTPEVLRGGNLINSLMQLVGSQLGGMGFPQAPPTYAESQSQAATSNGDAAQPQAQQPNGQAQQTNGQAQQNNGQTQQNNGQTQARVNTQTNPTTATHTRSTPRPHIHMTQQAVQGGFDPFLPCYSHHVSHARGQRIVSMAQPNRSDTPSRENSAQAAQSNNVSSSQPQPQQQQGQNQGGNSEVAALAAHLQDLAAQFEDRFRGLPNQLGNIGNLMAGNNPAGMTAAAFIQAMRNGPVRVPPQQRAPPPRGAPDGQGAPPPEDTQNRPAPNVFSFLNTLMGENLPDLLGNGPTLDQYLQSFHPEEPYVQGESLITDLIMLLLRNLRLNDIFMINSGNLSPLHRQLDTIQEFFRTEVCQNDTSDEGINNATERIMNDMRAVITAFSSVQAKEDIDMVRSVEGFFRQRLPIIIRLALSSSNRTGGNLSRSSFLSLIWRSAKELLALTLFCSASGQQGIENVFDELMFSTIFNQTNIPQEIHSWTIASSRTALRSIISNLDVRPNEIQQFVVRRTPIVVNEAGSVENLSERVENETRADNDVESMDVDYAASPANTEPVMENTAFRVEDTEPLPNVIWGSESWHRQTPEDWVPIITRDVQKQRRQNSQPPFSDAYLSGMPSKRRKLINRDKPQGSLSKVITESVRQAITATGVTSTAPIETVSQAAGGSADIQAAYRSLLRTQVQANLRENEDFSPERFPNAANYFTGTPPE